MNIMGEYKGQMQFFFTYNYVDIRLAAIMSRWSIHYVNIHVNLSLCLHDAIILTCHYFYIYVNIS